MTMNRQTLVCLALITLAAGTSGVAAAALQDPDAFRDDQHCPPQTAGAKVGFRVELDTIGPLTWDIPSESYGIFQFEETGYEGTLKHWFYRIEAGVSLNADWCETTDNILGVRMIA